jgi:hypothetical protein
MDHDEVPANIITGPPFINIPTNHPYDLRYALVMGLVPEIDPPSVPHQTLQNWTTPSATSVVTQSPLPTLRFRKIRPRPSNEPPPTSPATSPPEARKRGRQNRHHKSGCRRPSKHSRQLDHHRVQGITKGTHRAVSGVTGAINHPARR